MQFEIVLVGDDDPFDRQQTTPRSTKTSDHSVRPRGQTPLSAEQCFAFIRLQTSCISCPRPRQLVPRISTSVRIVAVPSFYLLYACLSRQLVGQARCPSCRRDPSPSTIRRQYAYPVESLVGPRSSQLWSEVAPWACAQFRLSG
jgi:hypothetical protein